jgi:pilus assembly protein Flp/PilA
VPTAESVIGKLKRGWQYTAQVLASVVADESGQDLIEYALVAALIAVGAAVSLKTLGTKISTAFTNIGTTLSSAS